MKKESLWNRDIKRGEVKELNHSIKTDVLIIGGGITGLTTAYSLKDSSFKVTLVEQNLIASGVSSRTTGKINFLQETVYTDLEKLYSSSVAEQYLRSQLFAIEKINSIIKKEKIKCDLDQVTSFVFTNKKKDIHKIQAEKKFLENHGISVEEYKDLSIPLHSKYAISVEDTYVFHPLKYLLHLKKICEKKGVSIYENTRVQKLKKQEEGYICYTDHFEISASKVILACHYPFFLKPFFMPLKVYTEKSYIAAFKKKEYKKETYITSSLPCKSIRYHKENQTFMLYLANSHKLSNHLDENKNFNQLIREAKKFSKRVDYVWENDDMMSVDHMPYIGLLERKNKNLLIGTGYNTWGMTNGTLAGFLLGDLVLNRKNPFEKLLSPLRVNRGLYPEGSTIILATTMKSYIENKIYKNKKWYSNQVEFLKRNGENIAIYHEGRKKYIVYNKCPHMGCSLIFNDVEKTWDCPCHASRFSKEGKCIKGPSYYDITYKDE